MSYLEEIHTYATSPEQLEGLYRQSIRDGKTAEFQADLLACYQEAPQNLLLAAWYYRLQAPAKEGHGINWKLAAPLAVLNGLLFWALSGDQLSFSNRAPYLLMFWAPLATVFVMLFLAITAKTGFKRILWISAILAVASVYALLILPVQAARYFEHAQILMALHLPVLAWAGVGICILGLKSSSEERFAFLIKSLEVFITGGLYLMAGMAFGMITFGMFQALSIELPDFLQRLVIAGGVGLLPVIAVASIYDPHLSPALQDFRQGLSRFIANMMRLLLPLTLGVLVIYCFVIPFNFLEPFKNRDVLIVYNVMLFAVMALLLGATPIRAGDLSQKVLAALRGGILAVAALAALISLYAMSATVYRTIYQGGITMNRLTIIGWNAINIGILVLLLVCLLWKPKEHWIDALKSVFSIATVGYVVWAVFLIIAVPLLFL